MYVMLGICVCSSTKEEPFLNSAFLGHLESTLSLLMRFVKVRLQHSQNVVISSKNSFMLPSFQKFCARMHFATHDLQCFTGVLQCWESFIVLGNLQA